MTSDVRREPSGVPEAKLCIYLLKKFFIEVQLIYIVVLVSGVQQSDSVIHIHTYIYIYIYIHIYIHIYICVYIYVYIYIFFFRFFSLVGYYKMLSIVPCAIQQIYVGYLFYIQQYVYVNSKLLIYPSLPFPLW